MNSISSQFLPAGSHYLISKVISQISLEPLVAEMKSRSEMPAVVESYRALASSKFEFRFGKGFQSVSPPNRRYHLPCWIVLPTSYFCQLLILWWFFFNVIDWVTCVKCEYGVWQSIKPSTNGGKFIHSTNIKNTKKLTFFHKMRNDSTTFKKEVIFFSKLIVIWKGRKSLEKSVLSKFMWKLIFNKILDMFILSIQRWFAVSEMNPKQQ